MKIRVQMPQGTGQVSVAGQSYEADSDGIVTLDNPHHVAPLVSAGGVALGEDGEPGDVQILVGSDNFPANLEMPGDADDMSLGDLVAKTHAATGVSVDEWNNLPPRIRDIILGYNLGQLQGRIGDIASTQLRLDEAIADANQLREDLGKAQDRIAELQREAPAGGAPAGDDAGSSTGGESGGQQEEPPVEKPVFSDMTKATINDWLSKNGGEQLTTGNHDAFVTAAEARWAELHPAA